MSVIESIEQSCYQILDSLSKIECKNDREKKELKQDYSKIVSEYIIIN